MSSVNIQRPVVPVGDLADRVAAPDDFYARGILAVDDAVERAVVRPEDLVLVGEAGGVGKLYVPSFLRGTELGQLLLRVDHADLTVDIAVDQDLIGVDDFSVNGSIRQTQVGERAVHGQVAGDVEDMFRCRSALRAQGQADAIPQVNAGSFHGGIGAGGEAVARDAGHTLQGHIGQGEQAAAMAAADVTRDRGAVDDHAAVRVVVILADAAAAALALVIRHRGVLQGEGLSPGIDAAAGHLIGDVVAGSLHRPLGIVAGNGASVCYCEAAIHSFESIVFIVFALEHAAAKVRGGAILNDSPAEDRVG